MKMIYKGKLYMDWKDKECTVLDKDKGGLSKVQFDDGKILHVSSKLLEPVEWEFLE